VRRQHFALLVGGGVIVARCVLFPSLDGLTSPDATTDGSGAIAFVQQVSLGPFAPYTVPIPAALTRGDALIVCVETPLELGSVQVSDTLNQTFTLVATTDGLGKWRQGMWVALDGPGGLDTVNVTTSTTTKPDGAAADIEVYVIEYQGITALETNATSTVFLDGGYLDAYVPWDAGTLSTTAQNELLFGWAEGAAGVRFDPSFSSRSTFHGNAIADMLTGDAGPYRITGTANASLVTIVASFK
jgi:hypothetical protein